jgi:hypothetical protein
MVSGVETLAVVALCIMLGAYHSLIEASILLCAAS